MSYDWLTENRQRHRRKWTDKTTSCVEYSDNIGSICIQGKELLRNFHSTKNTGKDLTVKQMFDISENLIAEQSDEIYGVNTTGMILHGNIYL